MTDLLPALRLYAARHGLFELGRALVVGVSGGPDSVCLLHLLRRLAPELGLRLHVAHLHHGLRGADADADAAWVAALAGAWDLPCTVGRADVAAEAATAGLSLEEAARQARYRFLAAVAANAGAPAIAVGHNADDQAETVLMHFLRGSGVAGLRGMLPRAPLGEYWGGSGWQRISGWEQPSGGSAGSRERDAAKWGSVTPSPRHFVTLSPRWLVRPLLTTPRAEIAAYCAEQGLAYRVDASNADTTFFRNRLRHELLPILAGYNPAIAMVLAHTADVLSGDFEVLQADLAAAWGRVIARSVVRDEAIPSDVKDCFGAVAPRNDGAVLFDLAGWRALPTGLQRATLREAVRRLRHSLRDIGWEHIERALWLGRTGTTGQRATLAGGLAAGVSYGILWVGDEDGSAEITVGPSVPQVAAALALAAPGITPIGGGWQISVERLSAADLPSDLSAVGGQRSASWIAWLDADAVGPELIVRPRRPGDRFQPHGMGGQAVRVNEFMINTKIAQPLRAGWPLLEARAGIAWLCGLRLADWAAIRPETRSVWRVMVTR